MKSLLFLAPHALRIHRSLYQMQIFQGSHLMEMFQNSPVKMVVENTVASLRKNLCLRLLVVTMALCSFASQPLAAQFNIAGTIAGTTDPVTLNVTGSLAGTFFSGAGSYILTALPNGTYTITPSLTGYTFVPTSRTVTVAGANVTGADFTATLIGGPNITSFSPTAGPVGTTISIFGNNLTGTTQISFGGVLATVFTNISATQVNAVVPVGAVSGPVALTTGVASASLPGYTLSAVVSGNTPPTITPIANQTMPANTTSPVLAFTVGDAETPLNSLTLFAASSNQILLKNGNIRFSGTGAARTVQLTPEINETGTATVTIGVFDGMVRSDVTFTLTVTAPITPVITSFAPSSAARGEVVRIVGQNFTGASSVTFGGVRASTHTVSSDTVITAVVGNGASGNVTVLTAGGAATATGFVFLAPPPSISGFTPQRAASGTEIRIFGQNFVNVTTVTFGGVAAQSITINSATQITAVVGNGASGAVRVISNDNIASLGGFSYLSIPTVLGLSQSVGSTGSLITIFGFGFTDARRVRFGGVDAATFSIISDTQINAIIGAGASGEVSVTNEVGTGTGASFIFQSGNNPSPLVVSGFTPSAQYADSILTIFGVGFAAANSVTIGGAAATPFNIVSDTQIRAIVPRTASSGAITVTSAVGSSSAQGFTFLANRPPDAPPTISAIADQSVLSGGTVAVDFFVGSAVVPASTLLVIPTSSNPLVVPNGGLTLLNNGSTRRLFIQPTSGQSGQTTITLTVSDGQRTASTSFRLTVTALPSLTINSIAPLAAGQGEVVVISGTGFTNLVSVSFGGVPAQIASSSETQIIATLGSGASGDVRVITSRSTTAFPGFTYLAQPVVTDFSPKLVQGSGTVLISGRGFTGATQVTFGSTPAVVTVLSDERISATVTSGSTGEVRVTTPRGAASLAGFTYLRAGSTIPPSISPIPSQTTPPNRVVGPLTFAVEDVNFPSSSLQVFPSSSNPLLLPNQNISFQTLPGSGSLRTVTLVPTPGLTGSSVVTLVVFNGLLTNTTQFTVTVQTPSSIGGVPRNLPEERKEDGFRVYPNPIEDYVTVQTRLSKPAEVTMRLVSMLGSPVLTVSEKAVAGEYMKQLDMPSLPMGIYMLEVSDGERRWAEKIIKR